MTDFTKEKQLVRGFYAALDTGPADSAGAVLAQYCLPNLLWRGAHPFNEIRGPEAVAALFWTPLCRSLTRLQRRMDVFMAGRNEIDGKASVWVVTMGHLMGLFDAPFLGIVPTRKLACLRYCSFHRVQDGRIAETAMFVDIPHLMAQAGQGPFPVQTAAHLVQPGPVTHDGLMFGPQPAAEGDATLALINAMIGDLGTWQSGLPLEQELARTWHDDMIWWGPEGIGATCTIERYARQHSGPFRAAFSGRSKTQHLCRLAEGHFGGFFGWPNFTAVQSGRFMGIDATDRRGEMRVVDIYRRQGGKLAENWVFIDLLHFWNGLGHDFLPG